MRPYSKKVSAMRYPGSKIKQADELVKRIPTSVTDWSEPFAGSLAVTLKVAQRQPLDRIHINDFDYGVYALWNTVVNNPDYLVSRIQEFAPTASDFYSFKEQLNAGGTDDIFEDGFRKLALHQISYSGLGPVAGSPIGGRHQSGTYTAASRWNPVKHAAWVQKAHETLARSEVTVTNASWEECLDAEFVYLDPPYYLAGKRLYAHGTIDHALLAQRLSERSGWLLSYDEHEEVRKLYSYAQVENWSVLSNLHHKSIEDVIVIPADGNAALWSKKDSAPAS